MTPHFSTRSCRLLHSQTSTHNSYSLALGTQSTACSLPAFAIRPPPPSYPTFIGYLRMSETFISHPIVPSTPLPLDSTPSNCGRPNFDLNFHPPNKIFALAFLARSYDL